MTNDDTPDPQDLNLGPESGIDDEGVLDPSDTLEDGPDDDPLDPGIIPADRWSAGERFGTTAAEEEEGESLDQLLAEEEPDVDPYANDDDDDEEDEDEGTEPDPRAGRLVAEADDDEVGYDDDEADLVARDVGIDAGGASAEEAAVHRLDSGSEDAEDEYRQP
jgi:hypothetical protein